MNIKQFSWGFSKPWMLFWQPHKIWCINGVLGMKSSSDSWLRLVRTGNSHSGVIADLAWLNSHLTLHKCHDNFLGVHCRVWDLEASKRRQLFICAACHFASRNGCPWSFDKFCSFALEWIILGERKYGCCRIAHIAYFVNIKASPIFILCSTQLFAMQ